MIPTTPIPTRFGLQRSQSSVFSSLPPPRPQTPKDLAGKSTVDMHARVQANFDHADNYKCVIKFAALLTRRASYRMLSTCTLGSHSQACNFVNEYPAYSEVLRVLVQFSIFCVAH